MMSLLNLFVLGLVCITVTSAECPKSYFGHDESCYVLIRVKASWAEAATYCSAIGAQLSIVDSDAEQGYLKAHLANESTTIDGGVWIAGLDYMEEGTWVWAYQAGAISKTFWGPKDPNNLKSGNTGQNCLMLYKSSGFMWDDHFCSAKEFFLCEIESPLNPQ